MLVADMRGEQEEHAFMVNQLGPVLVTARVGRPRPLYGIKYGHHSRGNPAVPGQLMDAAAAAAAWGLGASGVLCRACLRLLVPAQGRPAQIVVAFVVR